MRVGLLIVWMLGLSCMARADESQQMRPNVLFIAIDDLNDWASPFGGHPQAITPNLERFAKSGSVVFQNASCAGPVCGPSRSALLSGFRPSTTGVYGNSNNMLCSPIVQQNATLPEYFAKHGYQTISRGKIFHAHSTRQGRDQGQWAFQDWSPAGRGVGVDLSKLTSRDKNLINGRPGPESEFTKRSGSEFAWGPTRGGIAETSDYKVAQWAAGQLQAEHDRPFFLAVGLFRPHLPFFAPQEFFDLYDIDRIELPPINEGDLADIVTPAGRPKFTASADYLWLKQNDLLKQAARAYLAMVSYADANLGVIFDALQESPHAGNTIVVVWGDHGWHLGEKLRYRKATGWGEATRVPLIVKTPDMDQRSDCDAPVNLLDLYPTLVDYCGLPPKSLDGDSFVPLLNDPNATWRDASVTIFGIGNASVVGKDWRYVRHRDATEELYDLRGDPQEWVNLAGSSSAEAIAAKKHLDTFVPERFADEIPRNDPKWKQQASASGQGIQVNRDLSQLR